MGKDSLTQMCMKCPYKQLVNTRKKENDEMKKANQKNKVSKPAINPRFKR